MKLKRTSTLVTLAASVAVAVGVAGPASAASETCPAGQFCLYYNTGASGSFEHWGTPGTYNLYYAKFTNYGNGSGYGQSVYDNAASAVNNTPYDVFLSSTLDGAVYVIYPTGAVVNFKTDAPDLYNLDGELGF